jgi:rhodanese-related sulfurtransferase
VSASAETREVEIDPARVAGWLEHDPPPQLIDVREAYERDAGHIAASRHVELGQLAAAADSIERERPVIFYCRVGSRSLMAAQAFRASGYEAYSMRGGLARWAAEGNALVPPGGYVADHGETRA